MSIYVLKKLGGEEKIILRNGENSIHGENKEYELKIMLKTNFKDTTFSIRNQVRNFSRTF